MVHSEQVLSWVKEKQTLPMEVPWELSDKSNNGSSMGKGLWGKLQTYSTDSRVAGFHCDCRAISFQGFCGAGERGSGMGHDKTSQSSVL